MGSRGLFPRLRTLTLEEQIFHMFARWPAFRVVKRRRQLEVVWRGSIQPAPLSSVYTVSVRLRPGWCPEVRVLSPGLVPREGADSLPHIYPDGSLCLNENHEWNEGMLVAETTLPWASAWLYFYEVWHGTGLWRGGGTHPERPEHRSE
jgi:hypothetical protein